MPTTTGTITNIKLSSFLNGTVNSFDTCMVTLLEAGTGVSWLFYLWISRDDDLAVHRILGTQRLALAREAAFRKLTSHLFTEIDSSIVDEIQVDMPTFGGHAIAMAWGDNNEGELGNGTTIDHSTTPVRVQNLEEVKAIASGDSHALALKIDGTVWAWGNGGSGQLGDGTFTAPRNTPAQVHNLTGVTAITCGSFHSLARKSDGTVWAWGDNIYGELGDGTKTARNEPVQVQNLSGVAAITAGSNSSLALKSDGTVWAWGANFFGQLGDGTTTERDLPMQVQNLTGIIAISVGSTPVGTTHVLALKDDGTIWAWGDNSLGQLGDGTQTEHHIPVHAQNLSAVTAVSAGGQYSLALKDDGTVWAWGRDQFGELGDGANSLFSVSPVQVQNLTEVIAIAAGPYHGLALKDGTVWAWGENSRGSLGDGTTTQRLTPVQVQDLSGVSAIASGLSHSYCIRE